MANITKYDCIVVGAGLAGLTAARELVRAGLSVIVLEASERVGGRVLSHTLNNGVVVDLGGQWIGPHQHAIHNLRAELELDEARTYDTGDDRLRYEAGLHPTNAQIREVYETLTMYAREIPLERPMFAPCALGWDGQTAETWLRRATRTRAGLDYWRAMIRAIFAVEAHEISMLHFLYYIKSNRGLERIAGVRDGAQESRIIGGAQELAVRMAAELEVRLASPVAEIVAGPGGVAAVVAGERTVNAERVIVAVPPVAAGRIIYTPSLPPGRDGLTQRVPMGAVSKFFASYPEPFWRDADLSGAVFDLDGPITAVYDNSPPDRSAGVLVGLAVGQNARILGEHTALELRRLIGSSLTRYFGHRAGTPDELIVANWNADEYARGGYAGIMAPGAWTSYGHALREPVGRIHWAGAETSAVSCGYMDGAIRSGERAAAEVLAAL